MRKTIHRLAGRIDRKRFDTVELAAVAVGRCSSMSFDKCCIGWLVELGRRFERILRCMLEFVLAEHRSSAA